MTMTATLNPPATAATPPPSRGLPPHGLTRVVNLSTDDVLLYDLPPDQAVVAAYAQFPDGLLVGGSPARIRDACTWEYEARYGHLREQGLRTFACGNWCALQRPPSDPPGAG